MKPKVAVVVVMVFVLLAAVVPASASVRNYVSAQPARARDRVNWAPVDQAEIDACYAIGPATGGASDGASARHAPTARSGKSRMRMV
jgi:hypothetical protein